VPAALTLVALKTIIHPLIVYALAVWVFDIDALWAGVAVVLAGMPTGVNIYLYAQRYDVAVPEVATAILVGTATSVVTVGALIALLAPV
jgi:predicted permease